MWACATEIYIQTLYKATIKSLSTPINLIPPIHIQHKGVPTCNTNTCHGIFLHLEQKVRDLICDTLMLGS